MIVGRAIGPFTVCYLSCLRDALLVLFVSFSLDFCT